LYTERNFLSLGFNGVDVDVDVAIGGLHRVDVDNVFDVSI
jgi:hypothetical protein